MRKELTERGLVFADVFARFGVANRILDYADAVAASYPTTPSSRTWGLGPNQRGAGTQSWRINHLATRYFSFVPGKRASTTGKLRLWITLPPSSARASLVIVHGQLAHRAVPEAERDGAVEPAGGLRPWHDQARRPRPLERQHADVVLDELRAALLLVLRPPAGRRPPFTFRAQLSQ